MKIKISADSTCDLSTELIEQYDISILPLHVQVGEKNLTDGVDVTPVDLYAHVSGGGSLPKTQAINVDEYQQYFSRMSAENDNVIHINISSDFSSCYQNACLAAQDFPNVSVIDSRNLSTGHGHVVMEAVRLAQQNLPVNEIVEQLKAFTSRVDASFILEQLEYMKKGGRCSTVSALGANLLKLRPCIEVKDGKMGVGKKYRGHFDNCLTAYIHDRLSDINDIEPQLIFITHSGLDKQLEILAYDTVSSYHHFKNIVITHAGCTVCSHCGPSTIGVLYVHKA